MPKAVLDTNVIVSALLSAAGPPAELLRELRSGSFQLIVSPRFLEELRGVIARPYFATHIDPLRARETIRWLEHIGIPSPDPETHARFTPDPKDDYLVALARAAGADVLVSGDRHLTELEDPRPPVLTPREFLDRLNA